MTGRLVRGLAPNTPEWLAWRAWGVTATDTAAVLGLHPSRSYYSVWWSKQSSRSRLAAGEQLGDELTSQRFLFGHEAEPLLARAFTRDVLADEFGPDARLRPGGCWQHPNMDWLRCTPDRWICATRYGRRPAATLELKTDLGDGFGDDLGDGVPVIPVHYRVQVLHQMLVLGVDVGWITVLTRQFQWRHYRVVAQPGELDAVLDAATRLHTALLNGDEPPIDGSDATYDAIRGRWSSLDKTTESEIPEQLADEYAAAVQARKAAEQRESEARNLIMARIGDGYRAVRPDGQTVATRQVTPTSRFDAKALKADHPELWAAYLNTTDVVKLTAARPPKPDKGQPITQREETEK